MFVAKAVPPTESAYQSSVKPGAVAVSITVPLPHLDAEVVVGAAGGTPKVAITAVLEVEVQPVVVFLLCT